MNKKGQITLFILLGVILILLFLIIYFSSSNNNKSDNEIEKVYSNDLILPIRNYINEELDLVSLNAIKLIGTQGGYIYPYYFRQEFLLKKSYLYYDGLPFVPTIEMMEEEISKYIKENIKNDLNFSDFNTNVVLNEPNINTKINNETIIITINLPFVLDHINKNIVNDESFIIQYKSRLSLLRDISEEIVFHNINSEDELDFSYFLNLTNLDLNLTVSGNYFDSVGYNILDLDLNMTPDGKPYKFSFYEKYDTILNFANNSPPRFINIIDLEAKVGSLFFHKLEAIDPDGDNIIFSAQSMYFEISEFGEITFLPTESDIGEHIIPIYVTDTYNQTDQTLLRISIKP